MTALSGPSENAVGRLLARLSHAVDDARAARPLTPGEQQAVDTYIAEIDEAIAAASRQEDRRTS